MFGRCSVPFRQLKPLVDALNRNACVLYSNCINCCYSDHLQPKSKDTVGILDLGGGSTQITFLPKFQVSCVFIPLIFLSFIVWKPSCKVFPYCVSGDVDDSCSIVWRRFSQQCLVLFFSENH